MAENRIPTVLLRVTVEVDPTALDKSQDTEGARVKALAARCAPSGGEASIQAEQIAAAVAERLVAALPAFAAQLAKAMSDNAN